MKEQEHSYSQRIGKTTFIVNVKRSESAKKPLNTVFQDICKHEVLGGFFTDKSKYLDKLNPEDATMDLRFDTDVISGYHSNSQIARLLTENWVRKNMYCPRCGRSHIEQFENNRPVADFFCPQCSSEFELFDFGDEWRFQCLVLQELEEKTDIPAVIKAVGEPPEQYPSWEDDD